VKFGRKYVLHISKFLAAEKYVLLARYGNNNGISCSF
jgi:hypothetical protein